MRIWLICAATLVLVSSGYAALTVPGADGSDGVFSPSADIQVDLSQAPTGAWNGTNAQPGKGVYDASKWAVVFRYSSVNITSGKTVTFRNHPSRAPVVWLVSGDVTIAGTVNLSGQDCRGPTGVMVEPGPGGFRGGSGNVGNTVSAGLGPGGGQGSSSSYGLGGSFASLGAAQTRSTSIYGWYALLPLIGGSGSGGTPWEDAPGAGGAILIVAGGNLTVNGAIRANSGADSAWWVHGSSGGAVRLVADSLGGTGSIQALGGGWGGGVGRIRLEANTNAYAGTYGPEPVPDTPANPPVIWPEDSPVPVPSVKITEIGGLAAPADPRAAVERTKQDVHLPDVTTATVRIEARNVPLDWAVYVRVVVRYGGEDSIVNATRISGDATLSIWEAQVPVQGGRYVLQARAYKP
jgi:hypothetical protein